MRAKINQPTGYCGLGSAAVVMGTSHQKAVMAPAAIPSTWRSLGTDANVGAGGMSWRR